MDAARHAPRLHTPGRRTAALVVGLLALAGCAPGPAATPSAIVVVEDDGPPVTAPPSPAAPTVSASVQASPPAPRPSGTPTTAAPAPTASTPKSADWRTGPTVKGFDVSRYNPKVDWKGLAASGHRFVYIKATEGTGHRSPTHDAQLAAAKDAGLFHGAYHYARPASSDGATQARFFTNNGGAWRPDGRTLPGALDLEQSTTGPRCHGLTVPRMQAWVRDFSTTYAQLNGRAPVVYVKAEVWHECVGNARDLGGQPLWLYDHEGGPDPLPVGWERPTLWQRAIEANLDRNTFFGTEDELARWAAAG